MTSCNFTVTPTVHSKTELSQNADQTGGIALRLSVNWKHFKNRAFETEDITVITWFPWPSFPQTQIQTPVIVAVVWTDSIYMNRLRSENVFFSIPAALCGRDLTVLITRRALVINENPIAFKKSAGQMARKGLTTSNTRPLNLKRF